MARPPWIMAPCGSWLPAQVRLQFVRPEGGMERISIKFVMTFNADIECAIAFGSRYTKQHVAIRQLPTVQRDTGALVDRARQQLGSAGDTAPIAAAIRQRDAMRFQAIE